MRKFGEYVRAAYGCFSAKWIFGVLAALSLLPTLTKTVLLCITKESLTAGAVFFADLFCVVCACISAFWQSARRTETQNKPPVYGSRAVFLV